MPVLPWSAIDTVLLDMDGTLLDLHYDNQFWLEHLPQRYAELHGVSRAMAELELQPLFERNAGTLNWYCLDFWSRELNLPIRELKQEIADLIALRPDADTFLAAIRQAGKRVVLITNAHRDSLSLKLERVELAPYFERLISSTTTDFPRKPAVLGRPAGGHRLRSCAQPVHRRHPGDLAQCATLRRGAFAGRAPARQQGGTA